MKKIILLALATLSLVSCGDEDTTQTVKQGPYSIELPSYMQKTTGLNEDASLQFQHAVRELYIVVIDEPKSEVENAINQMGLYDLYTYDLNGYANLATDNVKDAMEIKSIPPYIEKNINGLPAKEVSFNGTIEGVPEIYYKFGFIEGKNNYYQIMTWTLANRKSKYEKTMQAMVDSFKETDKSAK